MRLNADALEKISSDLVLRKTLIAKGKTQVTHFSWRRMAEQTLGAYNTVMY